MSMRSGFLVLVLLAYALTPGRAAEVDRAEPWVQSCAAFTLDKFRDACERDYRREHGIIRCDLDGPGWKVRRKEDAMTDKVQCSVTPAISSDPAKGGLAVIVTNGYMFFSVLGDEYPNTQQMVRVDDLAPVSFDGQLAGAEADALLQALRSGTVVKTRYVDWPYKINRDRTFPICDLPRLIDECVTGR